MTSMVKSGMSGCVVVWMTGEWTNAPFAGCASDGGPWRFWAYFWPGREGFVYALLLCVVGVVPAVSDEAQRWGGYAEPHHTGRSVARCSSVPLLRANLEATDIKGLWLCVWSTRT